MKAKQTHLASKNKITLAAPLSRFLIAVALLTGIVSCGGKKPDESVAAPQGMHVLDLSRFGKPFAIFVPDTVAAKLQITEQNTGALEIRVGKGFAISINEQAADLNLVKEDLKGDEVNKLRNFIVDEPSALLWESAITDPEYHFVLNQKIGGSEYSFEDIRDTEANPFGKDAIQHMFDSCKNIKGAKKESKS